MKQYAFENVAPLVNSVPLSGFAPGDDAISVVIQLEAEVQKSDAVGLEELIEGRPVGVGHPASVPVETRVSRLSEIALEDRAGAVPRARGIWIVVPLDHAIGNIVVQEGHGISILSVDLP